MPFTFDGPPTEVLILGSQHLGPGTPDSALASTVDRLSAWRPDIVAVEVLPGELVELYAQAGSLHENLPHGGFPLARDLGREAQAVTGWTRLEAAAQAKQPDITPAERVLAFLAALEPWNALLHWTPALNLPDALHAGLRDLTASPAESVRIGVAVAARLGHRTLALIDDFPTWAMPESWWADYEAGADTPEFKTWMSSHPHVQESHEVSRQARELGDYSPVLTYLNSPHGARLNDDLETQANFRLGRPGRAKQASWDARNLFMAARLRLVTGEHPGGRVLLIVGSSHKAPMEAALKALGPDLRIVDFRELGP